MKALEVMAAKSDSINHDNWLPFKVHSLDTSGIIQKLFLRCISDSTRRYIADSLNLSCDSDESEKRACDFCRLIALLHDLGKLTPAFQKRITLNINGHTDLLSRFGFSLDKMYDIMHSPHAVAGQAILFEYGFPNEIAVIIGSHHGKATQDIKQQIKHYSSNYFGYNSVNETEWRTIRNEWINYSLEMCGFSSVADLPKPNVKVQMILTGLLIMSDWISSNTDYFPLVDIETYCINENDCKIRVTNAWKKLSLPLCWSPENVVDKCELFNERFGYFSPNSVQSAVMETAMLSTQPGLYILEAQMGVGKTEAALATSEIVAAKFGNGGVYFGLPTQATANGIFGRIKSWAETQCKDEKHTIRLAHGMTDLNEEYQSLFHGKACDSGDEDEDLIVHEWFEGRKQALLADFVVATVDQFLLASLKQKHVMLRHLGLSGKVVIIDECHAYDAYMNVYLDKTLTWMGAYRVPVIILSATLPFQRREELVKAYLKSYPNSNKITVKSSDAYPILTWTSGTDVMQKAIETDTAQKNILVSKIDECDLISCLSEKLSGGGCAAVIVNTVGYAQQLSKMIADDMPENEVICFHSRFVATDRAEIEKNLLARVGKDSESADRNGLIVVGTQVLEQSLDLDFDFMVTQLAPMDLLLQRCGRLHRHNRKRPEKLEKAEFSILQPTEDKSDSIYSKWILMRTSKYLPDKLVIPTCIPKLVNLVYSDPQNDDEKTSDEWSLHQRIRSDKKIKAGKFCINSDYLLYKRKKALSDFLDDDAGNSNEAEASVRDGDESIEVLVMQRKADGNYYFLPWYNGGVLVDKSLVPSEEESKAIARQRIRLPLSLSNYDFKKMIDELTAMPSRWRESHWLKGEMLLLLDENLQTNIKGRRLIYSRETGLEQE